MAAFSVWGEKAMHRIDSGLEYSKLLRSKRLRVASSLPALIGLETLGLLQNASFRDLESGIRIPRKRVYSLLLGALLRG
jgi:farnesyl-diphosphate farnesyltransferase